MECRELPVAAFARVAFSRFLWLRPEAGQTDPGLGLRRELVATTLAIVLRARVDRFQQEETDPGWHKCGTNSVWLLGRRATSLQAKADFIGVSGAREEIQTPAPHIRSLEAFLQPAL